MEISNASKKIAYIITLPNLGGAQSHLYEVMKHIGSYGYEPILLTGTKGWLTEQAGQLGIRFYIIEHMLREISPLNDWKAIGEIKKVLRIEQPAIVHCHSSKAGALGRLAAKFCGIPAVFTAHGWAFTEGVSPKKRLAYQLIEGMMGFITKKIICVSEYDRQLGVRKLPMHRKKMVTVHNCIPDTEYVRDWNKKPLGDTLKCIVIARFSPPKKNTAILRGLRELLDNGRKISVTFVGDGPDLPAAKAEAERLHLQDEAIFFGARDDVEQLLPQYDLFILLSNWEGFPISIIEAMRAGLPVVASDVGGVSEAVTDGKNGYLIRKDDSNFVNVLSGMSSDKEIVSVLGCHAREAYVNTFGMINMLLEIKQIYKNTIN